eukprot:777896_1
MRIYETDVWLQLDQHFQLKQIFTENKKDTNHYYIIQYHATDPFNIFSPYYTHNTGDMNASTSIIQLCNILVDPFVFTSIHHKHNRNIMITPSCTSCLSVCVSSCAYILKSSRSIHWNNGTILGTSDARSIHWNNRTILGTS